MKIAYLNPWRQAAENQCFKSLEQAAERIGCQLVHCSSSDEVIAAEPDFALAVACTQPKLTAVPTYGVIHEPRDKFLCNRAYYTNLLTYDGHLTISDSIEGNLRALLSGVGRGEPIGNFYITCQSNEFQSDPVAAALRGRTAKLTYFGTHWDKRRHSFFKKLSMLEAVEIYGPAHAWRHIRGSQSYKGALPFDGCGPQQKYAENALGLVLLADKHLLDDVISNRIFEIASVGAVALCPRMPWIEKHFGDSVYYFNQLLPDGQLLAQISGLISEIHADPEEALRRAQRAHAIFRERFSAEQMLKNARSYHEAMRRRAVRSEATPIGSDSRLITVIIRCGAGEVENLDRALRSVAAQTSGRFSVLVVRGAPLDLARILGQHEGRFADLRTLDCFGSSRAEMLWMGLRHVTGDFFCVLDTTQEWMPNHIADLLPDGPTPEPRLAYTGSVRVLHEPVLTGEKNLERRCVSAFGDCRMAGFFEAVEFIGPNSFLAPAGLLRRIDLQPPNLQAREDSLLILELLCHAEPEFNHRATAIHHDRGAGEAAAKADAQAKDLLELALRLAGKIPRWIPVPDTYPLLSAKAAEFFRTEARRQNWSVTVAAAPTPTAQLSPRAVRGKESMAQWRGRTFGRWRRSLHKRFPQLFPTVDDRPRLAEKALDFRLKR